MDKSTKIKKNEDTVFCCLGGVDVDVDVDIDDEHTAEDDTVAGIFLLVVGACRR